MKSGFYLENLEVNIMTVKEFIEQWSGGICLMDETDNVYCSFRENIPSELINKEIKKIKLDKKDILITI